VYVSNRWCLRARLVGANARLPGDYVHAIFVQHDDRFLNRLCYDKGVQQRRIVWEGRSRRKSIYRRLPELALWDHFESTVPLETSGKTFLHIPLTLSKPHSGPRVMGRLHEGTYFAASTSAVTGNSFVLLPHVAGAKAKKTSKPSQQAN